MPIPDLGPIVIKGIHNFDMFLNRLPPLKVPTDGTLGTDILLRGSVRAQSPNLGAAGLRNRALVGTPFTSILQAATPSKLSGLFQPSQLSTLSRLQQLPDFNFTSLLDQVNSGATVPRQVPDVQLFDINSASKDNLVAMLSRLQGEDVGQTPDSSVSRQTQAAIEQLIGAQRLEKEEESEKQVLGQNLLDAEVLVEEELQEIVREAMRQVSQCPTLFHLWRRSDQGHFCGPTSDLLFRKLHLKNLKEPQYFQSIACFLVKSLKLCD